MQRIKLSLIITLLVTLFQFVNGGEQLSIASTNDIETKSDQWMRISGGDPYLIYKCDHLDVEKIQAIEITLKGKHVINRHSYTEVFWANEKHGFTEEFKGFYINKFAVGTGEGINHVLNFHELTQALEDPGKNVYLFRIDLENVLGETNFEFQCIVKIKDSFEIKDPQNERLVKLHPPYQSQHLFKKGIYQYVSKNILQDFLNKLTRDPIFIIIYLGSILSLIVLISWILAKRNPWK